jgi:prolyl oligopeptidase
MTATLSPPAAQADTVVDILHGTRIADPYRWLEDWDAPKTQEWTLAQDQYTRGTLAKLPGRERIHTRLADLLSIGYMSAATPRGGRYFYTKREGDKNQPILWMREGLKGAPKSMVDPNELSESGTVALDWWYPSHDGKRLAYGLSEAGSEISTLRVLDTDTGKDLADVIPFTRAADVSWDVDNSGFYYTRYPTPGTVPEGEEAYHRHVFHHVIGTDPANDEPIWGDGREMQEWPGVILSPDGRYVLIEVYKGTTQTELYLRDLTASSSSFDTLVAGIEAVFHGMFLGNDLYIHTNHEASQFQVYKAHPANPASSNWEVVVPETESVLELATVAGKRLAMQYLEKASSRLRTYNPVDGKIENIELPALGTVAETSGDPNGSEVFYTFSSYFIPPTSYRYDVNTKTSEVFDVVQADIDSSPYEVEQVTYNSKDDTPVTMFLVHKKGLQKNGNNPTLLYGYGGFSSSITPGFQRNIYLWLEEGGIYAAVNLRGGGEYGEEWHKAGMLDKKQNVFDDFIAAAEWLIGQKYTSSEKLAIMGGSNGGLLVGAVLVQRPDLFSAVVCSRPLLDMIRYHKFLIAKLWIPEYGSADDPEQFPFLMAYSPYQNIKPGTAYPATLILTADTDTRVDPLHARKMAASLQSSTSADNPVFLWVETDAGHGAGAPLDKIIEEYTDIWSFVMWQLGMLDTK